MTSTVERGSIKKLQVDRWSTRERLCLASAVSRSGDQNWMSVSRSLRMFGEANRPSDWFSQKNCAVQYSMLLENVETPKRKKRSEKGEVHVETPGESILRKLTAERIEELKRMMQEKRAAYLRLKEEVMQVKLGHADDKLQDMLKEIQEEKKQKEKTAEAHQQWLREREEKKLEMERNWKQVSSQSPLHRRRRGHSRSIGGRRSSSQSEHSSEGDSPISEPSNADIMGEEPPVDVKPTIAPIPTSPLLTSLLKSPSPAPTAQTSRLQQAITSRGSSPTITSLLSSSPAVPTTVSSGLKNLVSTALSSAVASSEHPVQTSVSPSAGAPTLSMLLELPPSLPGKPLPEIPITASKAVLPPAVTDGKLHQLHQETPSLTAEIKDPESGTFIPIEPKIEPVEDIIHIEPKEEPVEEELIEEMVISDDAVLAADDISEIGGAATDDVPETAVVTEELQTVIKKEILDEYTSECEPIEPIMQIKVDPDEDLSAHESTAFESDIIREVKTEVEDEVVNKIEHVTDSGEEIVLDKDFEMIIEGTMQELTDEGDSKTEVADIDEVVEFDEGTEVKEVMPPDLADMEVIILGKVDDEVVHVTEDAKLLEVAEKDESSEQNVHSNIPDELPSIPVSNEAEENTCAVVPPMELQDGNISQSTQYDEVDDDSRDHHDEYVEDMCSSSVDTTVIERLSGKKENETSVKVTIKEENLQQNSEILPHAISTNSSDSRTIEECSFQESRPIILRHRPHRAQSTNNNSAKKSVEVKTDTEENIVYKVGTDKKLEISNDIINGETHDRNVSALEVEHVSEVGAGSSQIIHSKISEESDIVSSLVNEQEPDLQLEEENKHATPQTENRNSRTKQDKRDLDIHMEEKNSVQSPSDGNSTPSYSDKLSSDQFKIDRNENKGGPVDHALSKEADIKSSVDKKSKKEEITPEKSDSCVTNVEKETTLKDSTNISVHGGQNVPTRTKKNRKGSRKDNSQKNATESVPLRKDNDKETNKESSPKQSGEARKKSEAEKKESSKEINRNTSKKEEKEITHRRDSSTKRKDVDSTDEREDTKKRAVVKDDKRDVISKESIKKEKEVESSVKKMETKKSEKTGRTESKKDYKKSESKKEEELKILKSVEVTLEPVDIKTLSLPQEDTTESECESEKTSSKDNYRESSTQKDLRNLHVDVQIPTKGAKINIHLVRAETPSTEEEKTSDAESAKPSIKKRLGGATIDSLPGSPVFSTAEDEREYKAWKKSIMLVYGRLATHKYASLFLRPITDDQAPGYSSIVHRPMDLLIIKKNVETGMIRTTAEFQRDVLLMFQNAIMYNKSSHFVHKMAHQMQEEGMQHIQDFLTTQMLVQVVGEVPLRRETRTTEANKNRDVSSGQEEPETGGKRKRLSGPEKESHKKKKV